MFATAASLVRCSKLASISKGSGLPTTPTISIIDDDPWAREGIKDLVMSLGYCVLTFASAEEFMDSHGVDVTTCLITDLQMPGLSGLELQDYLVKRGHTFPIILVTAYPDEKYLARARDAGAFDFLTKPVDDKTLCRSLTAAVGLPIQ